MKGVIMYSDVSVLKNKKLFIFDMDGTIYLGNKVFPFAISFIDHLRKNGKKILFFTNNASRAPNTYYERLKKMGFSPEMDEIMTAGDITIEFLRRKRKGKKVYLVGTPDLERNFRERGIELLSGSEEKADIVVTSFDLTLTYEKLKNACRFIMNGAEFFSTHPDLNCPTENGFIPDSGAISAFVTASTGKEPTYFGKPYKETIDMISEFSGVSKEDMCIFGDRLYTDIALGKRHGVTSILVYTGETTKNDVEKAEEKDKPDFAFDSLENIYKIFITKE